jgi:hypothetical protein
MSRFVIIHTMYDFPLCLVLVILPTKQDFLGVDLSERCDILVLSHSFATFVAMYTP